MAGGMDILVIGIADDDNLDELGTPDELYEMFNEAPEGTSSDDHYEGEKRLSMDPNTNSPQVTYYQGETGIGSVKGAALGYLAKDRAPYDKPAQVSPNLLARIEELSDQFRSRMEELGLDIGDREVGLWMVNVRDT